MCSKMEGKSYLKIDNALPIYDNVMQNLFSNVVRLHQPYFGE